MFNYGNANEAQKEAISATDGLVLITAGPGTGKTFTLVKRAVYLIQECGIKPEQIMMATFTEKAAKELITRITNELAERNVSVNVRQLATGMRKKPQNRLGVSVLCRGIFLLSIITVCSKLRKKSLFASKYKLYLPTKEELKAEIETQKAMFYLQQQDNEDRNKNYTFNIE